MSAIIITGSGIYSLLTNLKISSSADNTGLNKTILKSLAPRIFPLSLALFSQSLSTGVIPRHWKVVKVVPFFKSGDRSSPLNYRPISLTSIIFKSFEHVIHSQVIKYLEEQNLIFKQQYDFRRNYSCNTQLASFIHDIHSSLDTGVRVDAIFVDFSKTFDRVPHRRLIHKLTKLNIDHTVVSWIKEFLSNRVQFTLVNNHNSSLFPVTSGVPQGSLLGPLLFLTYINDLPDGVKSNIRLFADDCVICRYIHSNCDRDSLQSN